MDVREISFENLPKAVAFLSHQIEELKAIIENIPTVEPTEKKKPIGVEQACEIIGKAKPTLYTLVRKRQIPHCKNGKKLYFYEEELLDWIAKGKRKTIQEIDEMVFQKKIK
ncbi:helix-turn-helix domain-containing protein [Capnocytophaga cynodegmi]|uniref:DNA binding domain, excisionase family n=1 Tax=Capnocytophaga cynodegmi TaxID=28189 RepID=A0A0B7HJ19_9FLAO|nr:helix-turn-helix domain-containing protein [Capnocytophaga cynodegmi]CEN38644.1 DNA binding domain, excisionase family [Capnocytophaga cynodegmi]CEN40909.1 DNA binding domain, excisionase family [Capnocytophaga cynodegmi]